MEERSDPIQPDAVFSTSRRVTFVVRNASSSRRFSTSRISRDPMGSIHVDVHPENEADLSANTVKPAKDASNAVHEPGKKPDAPEKIEVQNAPKGDQAARLKALMSPKYFPDSLTSALTRVIHPIKDRLDAALLFQAEYVDGHTEFLIGISGAESESEDIIEDAINSALENPQWRDIELGLTFLSTEDPMVVRISRVGHRLA